MPDLKIYQFSCLQDNFGVLIHDEESNITASIDAPEASAIRAALQETGWSLTHIFVTHHHHDHVGGIDELKNAFGCRVVGPKKDAHRIPLVDDLVEEGDTYLFGNFPAQVTETPGHTSGHIVYWFEEAKALFAGDTLFSLGCGRLFENPPEDMWDSLCKLMRLPPETQIYCGHEYTLSNGEFALTVDPDNAALQERVKEVRALRAEGKATLPTTLQMELETNPFLRASNSAIRATLGMEDASDADVFAEIRARKDRA